MVGEIFQYAASKGILKDQSYYEFEEDCQGQLTEEEYSKYMQQQQRSEIELFFEEKLRELFERKDDRGISIKPSRKDIRKIKKERRKSIKNFERKMKELGKLRNQ